MNKNNITRSSNVRSSSLVRTPEASNPKSRIAVFCKYVLLHIEVVKLGFASRLAYRTDFFFSVFAFFLLQFVGPLFVLFVYNAGGSFPGWTKEQILLLQGVTNMVKGFSWMSLVCILWGTHRRVRYGKFDLLLLRPVNTLWYVFMVSFDEEDIGQFVGGIVLTIAALVLLGGWNGSILLFFAIILVALLFFFGIGVLLSALTLRFVETRRLAEILDSLLMLSGYPRQIYSPGVASFFSTFFPLFVVGFYPASALLGLPLNGVWLAVGCTILLAIISVIVWYRALRGYQSAGG